MRDLKLKIPGFNYFTKIIRYVKNLVFKTFPGSREYWEQRYKSGYTSGLGSYKDFALFKAEVLNQFIENNQIKNVIEYGCGDGNQLKLFNVKSYLGFDVSHHAISQCKKIFYNDNAKLFKHIDEYLNETAQLTLSLDVIYHLVEDDVFSSYMDQLFDSSEEYVMIYSSNTDHQSKLQAPHVKHRKFTKWIEQNKPEWILIDKIPNRVLNKNGNEENSFADFYIYERSK